MPFNNIYSKTFQSKRIYRFCSQVCRLNFPLDPTAPKNLSDLSEVCDNVLLRQNMVKI